MLEFPLTNPVTVVTRLASGSLDIVAEERATATVDVRPTDDSDGSREQAEQTQVDLHGDTLTVRVPEKATRLYRIGSGGVRIQVRVPLDSGAQIKGSSARVACHGRLARLDLDTASGDVEIEHVTGPATVRTASGKVRLGQIDGPLRFNGASGDLSAQHLAGPVEAKLASGDVDIAAADDAVAARTASGDVRIGATRRGEIRIRTASGDVGVGVRAGTGVWLDLNTASGTTRNGLEMSGGGASNGHDLSLEVHTASGDIEVRRVA